MKTPAAPVPADPGRVATTQADLNRDTAVTQAIMNNVDQVTDDGSLRYTSEDQQQFIPAKFDDKGVKIPGTGVYVTTPKFTATQTLTGDAKRMHDLNNQTGVNTATIARDQSSRIGSLLATPFNEDGSLDRARVEQSLNDRLNPQLQRNREAMHTQLINRGVREGTQAYDDAMGNIGRQENDARLAVIAQGGNEQSQAIDRAKAVRRSPIEELQMLLGSSQPEQLKLTNTPSLGVAGVDYQGGVQNRDNILNNQYQQKIASQNAMMGGLSSLASAPFQMFQFSDRRLKKAIKKIGKHVSGLNIYSYTMLWDDVPTVGFMSDEVVKLFPNAVRRHESGFDVVDYAAVA